MATRLAPKTLFGLDGRLVQFSVPRKEMQRYYAELIQSDRSFYQGQYSTYGFLNTGDHLSVKTWGIKATPLLWQKRALNASCCIDVMGGTQITSTEVTTSPLVMALSQCPDEVFESCFESQIDPDTNEYREGTGTLLATAISAVSRMQVEALHGNLTVGGLLDFGTLTQPAGVNDEDWADVQKAFASTTGWITRIEMDGLGCDILQKYENSIPSIGCTDGSVLDSIFDDYYCLCNNKLRQALARGVRASDGSLLSPVFIVDPYTHTDVVTWASNPASQAIQVNGTTIFNNGNFRFQDFNGQRVVFYRNIPIIPEDGLCMFDEYTGLQTRSITMTIAGNIGIAARAERLTQVEGDMALAVQKAPGLLCKNVEMLSNARIGAGIADVDYLCSSTILIPNA